MNTNISWQPISTIELNDRGFLNVLSWNNQQYDRWRIWDSSDIDKMLEHGVTYYLIIPEPPK